MTDKPTPSSAAEFALSVLVAAGHVSQELVDRALALPGAPQPAHSGEPYGCVTTHRGTGQRFFYRYPEPPYLDNASECVTVYTAPQPVEREPLTDEQSYALLHRMADESDKWAEGLSYEPTREQVSGWCVAFLIRELPAHGIKGGQHGNE